MIEKSSINSDLSLYLLSYSRYSFIKHFYIKSNAFCMFKLKLFAYDSNYDNQNSIFFKRHRDQHIIFEDIQLKTDSN
jgi:hypothetical protein